MTLFAPGVFEASDLTARLFGVGYEGRSIDEVVALLTSRRIGVLVDVRLNAFSRKPGFSKAALARASADAAIEYRHEPGLGNPKANRAGFAGSEVEEARARYRALVADEPAFAAILDLTATQKVAMLCFESDVSRCHRFCLLERAAVERPDLGIAHL